MMSNPSIGDAVELCYAKAKRHIHGGLHGARGRVVVVSRGRPRNHGVEINGRVVIVPAGNLRRVGGAA